MRYFGHIEAYRLKFVYILALLASVLTVVVALACTALTSPIVCGDTWIEPLSIQASVNTLDGANNHVFAGVTLNPDPTSRNVARYIPLGGNCGAVEIHPNARSFAYFQRQVDGHCLWAIQMRLDNDNLSPYIVKSVVLGVPEKPDVPDNPDDKPDDKPDDNPDNNPDVPDDKTPDDQEENELNGALQSIPNGQSLEAGVKSNGFIDTSPSDKQDGLLLQNKLESEYISKRSRRKPKTPSSRYSLETHTFGDEESNTLETESGMNSNSSSTSALPKAFKPNVANDEEVDSITVIVAYSVEEAGTVRLESVTNSNVEPCVLPALNGFVYAAFDHATGKCMDKAFHTVPHRVVTPTVDNDVSGALYMSYIVRPDPGVDLEAESSLLDLKECGKIKPPSHNFLVVARLDNDLKCDWHYTLSAEANDISASRQILRINEIQSDYDQMEMVGVVMTLSYDLLPRAPLPDIPLIADLSDCVVNGEMWEAAKGQASASFLLMLHSKYPDANVPKGYRTRCYWSNLRRAFITRPQSISTSIDIAFTPTRSGYFHIGMLEVASPIDGCISVGLDAAQPFIAYYTLREERTKDGQTRHYPYCTWLYMLPPQIEPVEIAASESSLVVSGGLRGSVSLGPCGRFTANGQRDVFVARFSLETIMSKMRDLPAATDPIWAESCVSVVQLGGPDDDYTTALAPLTSLSSLPQEETVTLGGLLGIQALYTSHSAEVAKCVGRVQSRTGQPFVARLRLLAMGTDKGPRKGLPVIAILAGIIASAATCAAILIAYNWHKRYKLRREVQLRARIIASAMISAQNLTHSHLDEKALEESLLPISSKRRRRVMPDGSVVVEDKPLRRQLSRDGRREVVIAEAKDKEDAVAIAAATMDVDSKPDSPEARLVSRRYFRRYDPIQSDHHRVSDVIRQVRLTTTQNGQKILPEGSTILIPPLTEDLLMHISAAQVERLMPEHNTHIERGDPTPTSQGAPKGEHGVKLSNNTRQHPLQVNFTSKNDEASRLYNRYEFDASEATDDTFSHDDERRYAMNVKPKMTELVQKHDDVRNRGQSLGEF